VLASVPSRRVQRPPLHSAACATPAAVVNGGKRRKIGGRWGASGVGFSEAKVSPSDAATPPFPLLVYQTDAFALIERHRSVHGIKTYRPSSPHAKETSVNERERLSPCSWFCSHQSILQKLRRTKAEYRSKQSERRTCASLCPLT